MSQPNIQEVALFLKSGFYPRSFDQCACHEKLFLSPRMKTIVSITNVTPMDALDFALGYWEVYVHNLGLQLNKLNEDCSKNGKIINHPMKSYYKIFFCN